MKFPVYSDRDLKVGFGFPFAAPNDGYAARNFRLRYSDGDMARCAADFQLFRVGEFETDTGEILPCLPVLILDGGDIQNA